MLGRGPTKAAQDRMRCFAMSIRQIAVEDVTAVTSMYELELGCPSFGLFTYELLLLLRQTARVVGGSRDQKPRLL